MITDRKKDIVVLSGGDNVSPARIEGFLTLQPEISQAMVVGDKRPHLVGLLVPDPDWLRDWATAQALLRPSSKRPTPPRPSVASRRSIPAS